MSRKPKPSEPRKNTTAQGGRKARSSGRSSDDSPPAPQQPQLVVKRIRGAFLPGTETRERAVAERIYNAIEDFHADDGPTPTIAKWYRAVSHMPALSELSEELDLLADCNFSYITVDGSRVTPSPEALRRILLVRFLAGIVDRDGWYSARWFYSNAGIKATRLRQAALRNKLPSRIRPRVNKANAVEYSLAGAMELWPEDFMAFRRDNA